MNRSTNPLAGVIMAVLVVAFIASIIVIVAVAQAGAPALVVVLMCNWPALVGWTIINMIRATQ